MSLKIDRVQLEIIIKNDESRRQMTELETDIKRFKTELARMQKQGREGTEEYIQKLKELQQKQSVYDTLIDKIGIANLSMRELTQRQKELNTIMSRMNPNTKEYKELAVQLEAIKNRQSELRGKTIETQSAFSSFTGVIGKAADGFNKYLGIFTAFMAGFAGVAFSLKKAIEAFNLFEERIDNLSALTGLSGDNLKWLGDAAKQMSVSTTESGVKIKQSANDIVDAFTLMGSQRPDLLKNKEALQAVTQDAIILSEAAKDKLEPSARALAGTLNQFSLASTESSRVINILAAGSKEGAASIPYLSQAIEKVGTTANLMGLSVEQTVGIIEAVAPKFSKAEEAGNSFDKVLLKLKAQNIGYKNGVFDMNTAIAELEKRYASGQSAADIFGVEHAKMGEILVQNKGDIDKYTKAVTGTQVATEQAAINTNNHAGALAQAQNRIELTSIALGEKLTPLMTGAVNVGNLFLKGLLAITGGLETTTQRMERERTEVNLLVMEMTDANTTAKERNRIYDELNKKAPQVLEGINKEAIAYDKLRENLEKYNEEQINRIVIQQKQEELDKQNQLVAEKLKKKLEVEKQARLDLEKEVQNAQKRRIDFVTNYEKDTKNLASIYGMGRAKEIQTENLKNINDYSEAIKQVVTSNAFDLEGKINLVSQLATEFKQVSANSNIGINLELYKKQFEEAKNKSNEIINEREKLKEELGIKDNKPVADIVTQNQSITQTGGPGPVASPEVENKKNNLEAQKQLEEEFNQYIKKLRAELIDDAYLKAMEEIAIWYEAEKLKIENSKATEQQKMDALELISLQAMDKQLAMEEKFRTDREQKQNQAAEKELANEKQLNEAILKADKEAQEKELKLWQEKLERYQSFGQEIGAALGEALTDRNKTAKDFFKESLKTALDYAKRYVQIQLGIITVGSLATPDSILSFGATGLARAAVIAGLVEVGFAFAKNIVDGFEHGGYTNVTRAQDGKQYSAAYTPDKRGYISRPSILVGEENKTEYVVSSEKLQAEPVRRLIDYIDATPAYQLRTFDAAAAMRNIAVMRGYAEGGYTTTAAATPATTAPQTLMYTDPALLAAINQLNQQLKEGTLAKVGFFDFMTNYNQFVQLQDNITLK